MLRPTVIAALAALGVATGALVGCGSSHRTAAGVSTETITVTTSTGAQSIAAPTTSTGTVAKPAPAPAAGTTTPVTVTTATGTSSTRTEATAPPFVAPSGGAGAAAATVNAHGYTAGDLAEYHPNQTLQVLVGVRQGSGDGHDQRAFFFVNGRYIGTDSSQPSASLAVVGQSDTAVTLAYALYKPSAALCCPSGHADVTFELNNGQLAPQQAIPPTSQRQ